MRPTHLFIVPALAIAFGLSGCNDSTARSDYPDQSQETRAEADAIRREGERSEQVIARDLQQSQTGLAFAQQQNTDKAKLERNRITLERDQKVQPLEAKKAEASAKAKRDSDRITRENDAKIANANGDEANRLRAAAASAIAEVRREATDQTTELDADIRVANQAAQKRIANVDEGEAKEEAAIEAKRADAERVSREERLKVANDTTAKLDRVGKNSAQRRDQERSRADEKRDVDARITEKVQQGIAKHGEPARGVTVSTQDGVVVLTGAVTADTVRKQVVNDAQKISGVVRVDDRIAVH